MPQQLYLFPQETSAIDFQPSSYPDSLEAHTRELFQHQGSNAELVERIMIAVRAIDELCQKSDAG